jgi:hypothetical protein
LQKEYLADSAFIKAFLKSAEKSALPIAVSTSRNMPTTVSDCSSHSSPATGAVDTGAGDSAGMSGVGALDVGDLVGEAVW